MKKLNLSFKLFFTVFLVINSFSLIGQAQKVPNTFAVITIISSTNIEIMNNSQLVELAGINNWEGNGSSSNPIVISDLQISEGNSGFLINGVSLFVVIESNNITNGVSGGIVINNSQNIAIKNNDIFNNEGTGILVLNSTSISILDNHVFNTSRKVNPNTVINNEDWGIRVTNSTDVKVNNNLVHDNLEGIALYGVDNCEITNNKIHDLNWDGIGIFFATNDSKVINNTIYNAKASGIHYYHAGFNIESISNQVFDSKEGIRIDSSDNSKILNNTLYGNEQGIVDNFGSNYLIEYNFINASSKFGIYLISGTNNTIFHNYIVNNDQYGLITVADNNSFMFNILIGNYKTLGSQKQAYDDVANSKNIFDSNYWSDHIEPDVNKDGIVDDPYTVSGKAKNADLNPLTTLNSYDRFLIYGNTYENAGKSNSLPNFGFSLLIVTILVLIPLKQRKKR